jgi:Tol biopolymer transport system component
MHLAICCAALWFCAMTFAQSATGATTTATRVDGALPVISSLPASIQNPAFSPDGSSMIYTMFHAGYNAGPAGIFICAAAGGSGTPLIDEEGNDSVNLPGMSWNLNTNLITFASDRAGPDEIWTMAADGSKRTQVTHHPPPGYYIEPCFSPDGGWIVFEADTNAPDNLQQGSIFKVRADGTGQVKLTDGPANGTDDRQPNWSPTGKSILFQRRLPGSENWDIYTMNPDGTNLKQVTTTDSSDTDASFSPDGKWIVYSTDYGGLEMPNIFIIPAAGGSPIRITKNEDNEDGAPSWSPDGKWIAFESHPGADEDTSARIWRIPVSIPVPLITANNTADAVTVDAGKTVTIALNLNAGFASQQPADWWILHLDPRGAVESFDLSTMSFRPEFFPTFQGNILSFSSITLPVLSGLSEGNHGFYFAIDLLPNGQLDAGSLFYSGIKVFCNNAGSVHSSGSSNAKTVYNQAYQENFAADSIDDIIQHARNAYVLVDPFQAGIATRIADIQAGGNEVGCYISIGTGENWRQDFSQLQPYLVTKPWDEWGGEYFVNKTTTGIIPLMKTRIDRMATWGCNWVEFDNMDWIFDDVYRSQYSFQATEAEGIAYFRELCDYVHQKGMKCMAKNMVESAADFDGVLYESYNDDKNWWGDTSGTQNFLTAGKLVIINHYNETDCDAIYREYMSIYSEDISYICEDARLKKYIHY